MRCDKRKTARNSLKLLIALWAALTGYLFFHTWQWDPTKPFITAELFRVWFGFALGAGLYAGASAWDQEVNTEYKLSLPWQALKWAAGILLYFLIVLDFYAGVFVGMLFAFDATIDRLNPNADIDPVTIHPYIGSEVNRYLLLLFLIIITITQTFSVGMRLARWFNTNMASWLNLTTRPAPPKKPDKPPSQELDEQQRHTFLY